MLLYQGLFNFSEYKRIGPRKPETAARVIKMKYVETPSVQMLARAAMQNAV